MRYVKGLMLCGVAGMAMSALPQAQKNNINVLINGDAVAFSDQGPLMMSNRVMVPLRGVFEKLNATVNWDPQTDKITAVRNGKTVTLYVGKTTAMIGDQEYTLDQPATVINGRAVVPLRFLAESLGAEVDWRSMDSTVTITTVR